MLREGARDLLAKAVEAEVQVFMSQYDEHRDDQGRQQIVRNGYCLRARFKVVLVILRFKCLAHGIAVGQEFNLARV